MPVRYRALQLCTVGAIAAHKEGKSKILAIIDYAIFSAVILGVAYALTEGRGWYYDKCGYEDINAALGCRQQELDK
jgi:hypothetical protein